jgi:serine/threonine protein phosphatase 1
MARIYVTTDIHGEADRFKQLLIDAEFDYEIDTMINLGDCCDRGLDSYGVVEELLKIKNLIAIRGNHDQWMLEFIQSGCSRHPNPFYFKETILSYEQQSEAYLVKPFAKNLIPESHISFYRGQLPYHIDQQNRLFVHAGYNMDYLINKQHPLDLCWDRDFFRKAMSCAPGEKLRDINNFKQVFIGHTPTINWTEKEVYKQPEVGVFLLSDVKVKMDKPIYKAQVVNVDTGACFGGKLSMLDITDPDKHILYQN